VDNKEVHSMRKFLCALTALVGALTSLPVEAAEKVLLVVSSYGRDGGKTRPGFEFDEYAQAWEIFRKNGLEIEVASPAGGKATPDEFEPDKPYNAAVMAIPEAMRWLDATKRTDAVKAQDYKAVYVLGGAGAMFDVLADGSLKLLLGKAYDAGAVVGGVCHGPAVLASVRRRDGELLVRGRKVTGYTNAEEETFGKQWTSKYPVFLEDTMKASGARFEQGPVMLPHVVADGRLVTGQNPFSTALTVEAVLRAMGKTPVARAYYPDERSMLAVARFLGGDRQGAAGDLTSAPRAHDPMLIGMYGNALVGGAGDNQEKVEQGLALMDMAATQVSHPRLELAMAQAEKRLGRTSSAKSRLEKVLSKNPNMEAAKRLLTTLGE
jgi:putative intracellular protease/amidase